MIMDIASGHIYQIRIPWTKFHHSFCLCFFYQCSYWCIYFTSVLEKQTSLFPEVPESTVNETCVGGFNALQALSQKNDDPATASRPFDLDRDGFVMGEGGGCLVLEELEHAKARGAKIYAELVGGGMSADAYHMTAPHPEGLGAANVMNAALEDAGMTTKDIDYVNVHGTSTPIGDPQEIKAIQTVFGEDAYRMNISSTKSMTGHLLGAAGAIEAIASIMAVVHGIVPPTINHFTDDPAFDPKLNLTFNKAQHRTVNAALSNTFGFGGHNASVIFRKYSWTTTYSRQPEF